MPETTARDQLSARIDALGPAVSDLLTEADGARTDRDEDAVERGLAAWNHFDNIPTFYNWNNRPR